MRIPPPRYGSLRYRLAWRRDRVIRFALQRLARAARYLSRHDADTDWFAQFYVAHKQVQHYARALAIIRETNADLPDRAELERQNRELRRQLTFALENNHRRNLALDALAYVWCDGGCCGGVFRWTDRKVDAELVAEAKRNVARLERWWLNHSHREQRERPA